MSSSHPYLKTLLQCIALEEKEQVKRYSLDQQHTLKSLKAEGLALHPIIITRKNFGYADYPEITFRINFPSETNQFKDGAAIECFFSGEEPIKGVLINLDGKQGECRLYAPDFPDWIEDNGVGIKLAPDQRTTTILKSALNEVENSPNSIKLFEKIHGESPVEKTTTSSQSLPLNYKNQRLNESQQKAVQAITQNENITIVHGPPGTGKTTTLIEGILQLINVGEKILVSAPSNTAVDNIAKGLLLQGIEVLRVGNTSKVDEVLFAHTPEGKLANSKQQKEIKQLKIRAEEFRKMALKYKRSFGKAEREQRNLLFKEVKSIRTEIKKLQAYNEEKLYSSAQVIAGTPIGLYDSKIKHIPFNTLVIDEAGQCIEPMAWCIFPLAEKYVLAGDHLQLPPTVLNFEAARMGLQNSILEVCIERVNAVFLLNTQYRMRATIAGFSSNYFYNNLLQTAGHLLDTGVHLSFIDTAGSGLNEANGSSGMSLQNEGELAIALKLIATENLDPSKTAFISPYAGQVAAAKELLPKEMRISTIDSFQGQEQHTIILSLVRSNDEEQLFVIGDSATIGGDAFYHSFLTYIENKGCYRTVWEFEV